MNVNNFMYIYYLKRKWKSNKYFMLEAMRSKQNSAQEKHDTDIFFLKAQIKI